MYLRTPRAAVFIGEATPKLRARRTVGPARYATRPYRCALGECIAVRPTSDGAMVAVRTDAPGHPVRWVPEASALNPEQMRAWLRRGFGAA